MLYGLLLMLWHRVIDNEKGPTVTCCQGVQLKQEASNIGKAVSL